MFKDDDSGYRAWLAEHQGSDAYVLNAERNPKPTYLILHRATCHAISDEPARGTQWTHDFIKVCGSRTDVESFARGVGGRLGYAGSVSDSITADAATGHVKPPPSPFPKAASGSLTWT